MLHHDLPNTAKAPEAHEASQNAKTDREVQGWDVTVALSNRDVLPDEAWQQDLL
jgi:thiazole synthase ThiGH ThiG subunit